MRARSTRAASGPRRASSRTTGVYLPGASGWYPLVGRALMTFKLTVAQPATWRVVSEGAGTSRDADGRARWASTDPVDQIHIVGGPLQLTTQAAGAVEAQVYLHENDDALSSKYLAATAQYLEMYRGLIGPYPYGKFALVENFWETGYGMPSFTLLGPQIIRFPFILTSSYPHEILHNWWGNSVLRRRGERQLVRGAHGVPRRSPDAGAARRGRRVPPLDAAEVPRLRVVGAGLPARAVPRPPQRRHRGHRLRPDDDGLPRAAAGASATRTSASSSPASTATSRASAPRSTTCARRWKR